MVVGFLVFLNLYFGISYRTLTSDIVTVTDVPPYYGFLSQLSCVIWAVSATICFYTYSLVKDRAFKFFFLISGSITAYLLIDDLYLLHDSVYIVLGISQEAIFVLYAIGMLIYLFRFKSTFLSTNYTIIIIAFACFFLSLFIDLFLMGYPEYITKLMEESFKFIGLLFWAIYFYDTGTKQIVSEQS